MGERMVRRDFAAGIEARLHHKDFGLVLEAARQSGVPVPLAAHPHRHPRTNCRSGHTSPACSGR